LSPSWHEPCVTWSRRSPREYLVAPHPPAPRRPRTGQTYSLFLLCLAQWRCDWVLGMCMHVWQDVDWFDAWGFAQLFGRVRIVGLSATLPNYLDVAYFLRVNTDTGLFHFGSAQRWVGSPPDSLSARPASICLHCVCFRENSSSSPPPVSLGCPSCLEFCLCASTCGQNPCVCTPRMRPHARTRTVFGGIVIVLSLCLSRPAFPSRVLLTTGLQSRAASANFYRSHRDERNEATADHE
jgi:hypothetical protein